MKNLIKFLAVVALVVGNTSCDAVDELTEVDFNTTINESFFVTVPDGNIEGKNFDVNIVNSDTEDYLNLFQDVDITSFTYRLVGFNGDNDGTIVGYLAYVDNVTANSRILITHDMVVSQVVNDGTVFKVTDVDALNAIAKQLKSGKDVQFVLEGVANCEAEMTFTLKLSIELAIVADVL